MKDELIMSEILDKLQLDKSTGMFLIDWLKLKKKCSYCGKEITEDNLGGIYNKPLRAVCDDNACMTLAVIEQ